ncbi:hypothetical protein Tco_0748621 [Tanacetum coccineum]|uniref:Uncharacterized protein n=1 Tax=Tanacetum coccineum TaxID=301880 RepID=A0ABQ4YWC9_9ASTR
MAFSALKCLSFMFIELFVYICMILNTTGNINLFLDPDDEDDEEEYLDCEDIQEYSNHENNEECLDYEENQEYFNHKNDEEFTFMYIDENNTPIPADKASKNKDIHPKFPLFDLNLLSHEERKQLPINPQVNKVSVESDQVALSSTSECDTIESVAMGPYCTWKKQPPKLSKKSKSTCFPKLWRLKDKVGDGRDAFLFLKKPVRTAVEGSSLKGTSGKRKGLKAENRKFSGHEVYLRKRAQEGTVFAPALEGMKHDKSEQGEMLSKPFLDVCKQILPVIGLVGEYIAHGASSVVLSNAIFDKEAMAQRNFIAVYGNNVEIQALSEMYNRPIHIYSYTTEGGLQAKGIFRITGENDQEKDVRKQLNIGFVPDGVDVPFFAGLIKVDTATFPQLRVNTSLKENLSKDEKESIILSPGLRRTLVKMKALRVAIVRFGDNSKRTRVMTSPFVLMLLIQQNHPVSNNNLVHKVSYGSELSNRGQTFDMDVLNFMDGDQPISYEKAGSYFARDPS